LIIQAVEELTVNLIASVSGMRFDSAVHLHHTYWSIYFE